MPILSLRRSGPALPLALVSLLSLLAACHAGGTNGANIPGERTDTRPYAGIAADETVQFRGTGPVWSGRVAGGRLVYETPERPGGETIAVTRFAGRGGVSFSGMHEGAAFTLAVSPGRCSDGMSDRSFPFLVMLRVGETVREGCGWTDKQPYQSPPAR